MRFVELKMADGQDMPGAVKVNPGLVSMVAEQPDGSARIFMQGSKAFYVTNPFSEVESLLHAALEENEKEAA